jgi:hypothetical protein
MLNRGEAAMITGKSHHRKPDPLLLLAAAVLLCAVMTTAATAGDVIDVLPAPAVIPHPPLHDGGFTLASVGHEGGKVRMSLMSPYPMAQISGDEQRSTQRQETLSQVFVFLHYPW